MSSEATVDRETDVSDATSREVRQDLPDARQRRYTLLAIIAAVAVSIVYLHMSQMGGRLSRDLDYDDVRYVMDAAKRLAEGSEQGIGAFLLSFLDDPPHSPYSTLLATAGLQIGGYHEIAIYTTNSILLVLVAWFLARQFGAAGTGVVAWIVAAFLLSPLAYIAIHDFRPDIALGFATAAMVWWFSRGLAYGEHRAFTWAGIAFGAALLIKPAFFAHTLALALGLSGIHLLLLVSPGVGAQILRPQLRDLGRFLLIGLLMALPHFAVAGGAIFTYFWSNTQGANSDLWSLSAVLSPGAVALVFLKMQVTAGYQLLLAASLVIFGLAWTIYTKNYRDLLMLACLAGMALASFAILVFGRTLNGFFFASFQSLVLLAGMFSLSRIANVVAGNRRHALLGAAWLALSWAVLANQSIVHPRVYSDSNRFHSWNERIAELIARELSSLGAADTGSFQPQVFVAAEGGVNALTLSWTSLKKGLRLEMTPLPGSKRLAQYVSRAGEAHFVVVANSVGANIAWRMPSSAMQAPLLSALLQDHAFRLLEPPGRDTRYFVFANTVLLDRERPVMDVDGIVGIAGLELADKPFPAWDLRHARWMTLRDAQVCLLAHAPGDYSGELGFRALTAGFMTAIGPAGKQLARAPFENERFSEMKFAVSLPQGVTCFVIRVEKRDVPDLAAPLIFTRIAITRQP